MRLFGPCVAPVAVVFIAAFADSGRADSLPPPPLFELCWSGAASAVDVTVESADPDAQVTVLVNAVFVRGGADGGGPAGETQPGDVLAFAEECSSPTSLGVGERALLLLHGDGSCLRAFLAAEDGVLEEGEPHEVTVEEAGDAAVSEDCEGALADAGYDPPLPRESPLVSLFGCSASAASDAAGLLSTLTVLAALGRRRRRRARAAV